MIRPTATAVEPARRAPDRDQQADDDDAGRRRRSRARARRPARTPCRVLNARLKRSVQTTSMSRRRRARCSAQCLVSWSTTTTTAAISRRPSGARERAPTAPSRRCIAIGASSAADAADLLLDQHRRPRDRLEALPRDRPAGHDRVAVGAVGRCGASAASMSAIVWRACADRARSRSRSTTIVSPSPLSSSNWTSPISPSSISELASSSSRLAWPSSALALGDQQVVLGLEELDVEVLRVGDAVLGACPAAPGCRGRATPRRRVRRRASRLGGRLLAPAAWSSAGATSSAGASWPAAFLRGRLPPSCAGGRLRRRPSSRLRRCFAAGCLRGLLRRPDFFVAGHRRRRPPGGDRTADSTGATRRRMRRAIATSATVIDGLGVVRLSSASIATASVSPAIRSRCGSHGVDPRRRRPRRRQRDPVGDGEVGVAPGLLDEPDQVAGPSLGSSSGVTSTSSTTTPVPPPSVGAGAVAVGDQRQRVLARLEPMPAGDHRVAVESTSRRP